MKIELLAGCYLRFAKEDDCRFLFELRNDPDTRRYAFHSEELDYGRHQQWFHESLKNPLRNILILCDKDHRQVGQIRFDRNPRKGEAEIDIAIAPALRGKGYGLALLKEAVTVFFNNFEESVLIAKVKNENGASMKIFEKAGFSLSGSSEHHVVLTYRREV